MRRSQWFVFAIIFFALFVFTKYQADHQNDKWREFSDKELKSLGEYASKGTIWSEQDVVLLVRQQSSTHSYWDSYLLLWTFSYLYMAIVVSCILCGCIEPKAEKKR